MYTSNQLLSFLKMVGVNRSNQKVGKEFNKKKSINSEKDSIEENPLTLKDSEVYETEQIFQSVPHPENGCSLLTMIEAEMLRLTNIIGACQGITSARETIQRNPNLSAQLKTTIKKMIEIHRQLTPDTSPTTKERESLPDPSTMESLQSPNSPPASSRGSSSLPESSTVSSTCPEAQNSSQELFQDDSMLETLPEPSTTNHPDVLQNTLESLNISDTISSKAQQEQLPNKSTAVLTWIVFFVLTLVAFLYIFQ